MRKATVPPIGQTGQVLVTRADRSPMNLRRWCLTLSCGHEVWVTQTSWPKTRKRVTCKRCLWDASVANV